MIPQWIDNFLEALRRAVSHRTALDEILLGAIIGVVLAMILSFLGFFN